MAEKKVEKKQEKKQPLTSASIFTKDNYKWMLIGLAVMALGMFLMAGGASKDPSVFDRDSVYSFRRITVAPVLIIAGLVIEIYAIFKEQKAA